MDIDENLDVEDEVSQYPFGANAALDPNFLQALGAIGDRGLGAEMVRMIQHEGEERELRRWEKRLQRSELIIQNERRDLILAQELLRNKKVDLQGRLRRAKAASRLIPLLPDRPGAPGMRFPHPTRPYIHPTQQQRRAGACYWCGRGNQIADLHRARDCPEPHVRCMTLEPGRCVVPEYHKEYYSGRYWEEAQGRGKCPCPYRGDHGGMIPRGDHT
jgi:hypothetical protein